MFKECDLINIDDLKKTISEVKKKLGPISVLVNNAAHDDRHNIEEVTPEYWDNRMHSNLRHYFFTVQSVKQAMIKNKIIVK